MLTVFPQVKAFSEVTQRCGKELSPTGFFLIELVR